jgi:hypothetical protein
MEFYKNHDFQFVIFFLSPSTIMLFSAVCTFLIESGHQHPRTYEAGVAKAHALYLSL